MNETQQTQSPDSYDVEIDLRELFRVLWAGKWLIGGITFAATIRTQIILIICYTFTITTAYHTIFVKTLINTLLSALGSKRRLTGAAIY